MYKQRTLAHVLGHNFAPLAFQEPRLGLLTEQTASTHMWLSARYRPFGRDQDVTNNMYGIGGHVTPHENLKSPDLDSIASNTSLGLKY